MMAKQPGPVVLFGSGETSASGRRIYETILSRYSPPIDVAVLETPAGYQPNSARVAGRVADFLGTRLPSLRPRVRVIPARRRGTPFSPDDPAVCAPLVRADVIFLGAGSPTYAVRQLTNSLAWQYVNARHWLGGAVIVASAAAIAAGSLALPVYEIYKVGEDLHWNQGLELFAPYGLSLVIIPHWDNAEGGAELDTSRCFMGMERFEQLRASLPANTTVVGIDEHTALVIDVADERCEVMGRGTVTLLRQEHEERFNSGDRLSIAKLGPFHRPEASSNINEVVWQAVREAEQHSSSESATEQAIPDTILALAQEREAARARRDWAAADALRDEITARNWLVRDRPEGTELVPIRRVEPYG